MRESRGLRAAPPPHRVASPATLTSRRPARRAEAAAKKAEAKRLAEAEEAEAASTGKKGGKVAPPKVTAAQLAAAEAAARERAEAAAAAAKKASRKEVDEDSYAQLVGTRNANREEEAVEARSVAAALEALAVLDAGEEGAGALPGDKEKHPEKRMKAAFSAYEEAELAALQAEKPGLRRAQYREMLFRAWQRDPRNPMVQAAASAAAAAGRLGGGGGANAGE